MYHFLCSCQFCPVTHNKRGSESCAEVGKRSTVMPHALRYVLRELHNMHRHREAKAAVLLERFEEIPCDVALGIDARFLSGTTMYS